MEENRLKGQVAWVSGASRGIGLSIARRLGRMGAKVAICARNAEQLRQAASDLRDEEIDVLAAPADVTRAGEIAALVHEIFSWECKKNGATVTQPEPTYRKD